MDAMIEMPARDAEGYLVEPADWNEGVAERLARELDIELGDDHWDVLRHMRALYDERQIAPDARHIIKHLDERYHGAGRRRLFELFPYGYPAQACKVAGMKRPRGWSTG
jgi:tRNA 2-thiouridine synthesizing protein E